ncbi:alpha-1,2-fucosyltransferase [uncultured Parabacteroides sp.]|jgi:hypothetical protein|uniref:alpha-1,2-fucosyltransferase n=1 Tax=uncultured Parabacteroides sp. TaxID=512312 RepID=UPI0025E3CB3E|nr:alpha-1,2-fucosyltransferase [uncultured Parabacteroides sp.]
MIYSYLEGRLGNILFEIAAGASLAKKMSVPFKALLCSPDIFGEPDNCSISEYVKPFQKSILRNIDFSNQYPENLKVYQEPDFPYRILPREKDLLLKGYFQSERYFDEEVVRDLFHIDTETFSYIREKYGHLLDMNAVSILVRRGDYLKLQFKHPVCRMSYYRKAMAAFASDTVFLVISDDIEWCKKHFRGDNFFFVDDEPPLVDLYLQSLCVHNIISNSSFGWWGAWLNPNPQKRIICPTPWFAPSGKEKDTRDLCPMRWRKEPIAGTFELYFRTYYSLAVISIKIALHRIVTNIKKSFS